eukprot:3258380-Alexandrium_andersonii.AAC.1
MLAVASAHGAANRTADADWLGSLQCRAPKVQSAICSIHLNPQSALRNMQNSFWSSELELRGPGNGRKL